MADAVVERRPVLRFFCHRCLIEFEDILQDINYTCPYCEGGFIEQLEAETERTSGSSEDFSDADMSNIDDLTDDLINRDDPNAQNRAQPMLDDLAFLMSGGRLRGAGTGSSASSGSGPGRRHTFMEELVWMIGGARPNSGAMTAGAPFVLVGAPGDYVFGGEGLDAVVTQLLGQLEQAGPPPLPRERLAELPSEPVTPEQAAANIACSVCWDNFQLGETVSKLECDHVFHSSCITPWLQLHATCPICRRSLLPDPPAEASPERPAEPSAERPAEQPAPPPPAQPADQPGSQAADTPPAVPARPTQPQIRISPRVVIRRTAAGPVTVRRFPARVHAWTPLDSTSSSSASAASAGVWPARSSNSSANSSGSVSDRDRQYNTDIDYD